jgi:hypothetical protein
VIILILSYSITDWNLNLEAERIDNINTHKMASEPSPCFIEDGFDWGEIAVISEPIPNQNNNNADSYSPKIAVEDGKLYVVWMDHSDHNGYGGDSDIFYRYFDGIKWSEIQVISEPVENQDYNTGYSQKPDIAVDNGKIYVVWRDENDTNNAGFGNDIFYRCNLTGNNWEDVQVISEPVQGKDFNTGYTDDPTIAVKNGKIWVVWHSANNTDNSGPDDDIFYRANLTGNNWEDIQVISEPVQGNNFNTGSSRFPAIAIENNKIYVTWQDSDDINGAGVDQDIFYRCNLAGNWESIQVISEPIQGQNFNTGVSNFPSMAVENGKIFVVWYDDNETNNAGDDEDIFYRCNLTGNSWEPVQIISEPVINSNNNVGFSGGPDITVENGIIFIGWYDFTDTDGAGVDGDIFYRFNITGVNWEDIEIISEPVPGKNYNIGGSHYPNLIVSSGKNHIVWHDGNNTNMSGADNDIFYRYIYSPLVLGLPNVKPISGNTSTEFNFTVSYFHLNDKGPIKIVVNISGIEHSMLELEPADTNYLDGKNYFFNIKNLDIGIYSHQFTATDGEFTWSTKPMNIPVVYNTPPRIISKYNLTAIEEVYYEVSYEYEDIDLANVGQSGHWYCFTNASWLSFNNITAILNGTPSNDDVGKYWVNITIDDSMDIDFTNFTLTVIDINDEPIINTTNVETTYEDDLYLIDYNATDVDSPIDFLNWTLHTNASTWLEIESSTGIISGIPTNDDVGSYWVNVSVNDSEGGSDFTNFTLIVQNVNDPPEIITEDLTTAIIDEIYEVDYEAVDIDPGPQNLFWNLNTNAIWLNIDSSSGILSGTPALGDLGWYNVNVTVNDGKGGEDWHEFNLTVIKENLPPNITTEDVLSASVNELYRVDYDATDVDTPLDKLRWSLTTNASWLEIDMITGALTGTPALEDLGKYRVNVTVMDEIGAFDFHNFTLTVRKSSIQPTQPSENAAPELKDCKITPSEGDTETEFTFTGHYYDTDNDAPAYIWVVIDNKSYNLTLMSGDPSNGTYEYSTKLTEGTHVYYFTASDGIDTVNTDNFTVEIKKPGKVSDDEISWWWLILLIIVIIIILLILFLIVRQKKQKEEKLEEVQPPPVAPVEEPVPPTEVRPGEIPMAKEVPVAQPVLKVENVEE